MKKKQIANGLPLVADKYFCTYDIEKKVAVVFAPDGKQTINPFIIGFIKNEDDFKNFFEYISNIFGMFGNGQRGNIESEKFEWFFYKHNKKTPIPIRPGDAIIFDENYHGENMPAIYIQRKHVKIFLPYIDILFHFLKKESDIYSFVNTLSKFYGYKIKKIFVEKENLAWQFSCHQGE